MERRGFPEEVYFTFSYSPIRDDLGGIGGMFCACTETTDAVLSERRDRTFSQVAAATAKAKTVADACQLAAASLTTNPHDLPFAMIYTLERDAPGATLTGAAGIEADHPAAPGTMAMGSADPPVWPIDAAIERGEPLLVDTGTSFGELPRGVWSRPPTQAVVLPIAPPTPAGRTTVLIAGLNPHLEFNAAYLNFIKLVGNQIGSAIVSANAFEEERRRAEELAEVDRVKTAFFSNVSHEFRTPLMLMLGPLEETLAGSSGLGATEREQLQTAHRNSLRLLKLVNTLLDFSRIEAGRVDASYEPIDLATTTTDLASVFRSAIEKAGLKLKVDCRAPSEPVFVDRGMWEKIVLNLVSNAFKFTFEGEIEVKDLGTLIALAKSREPGLKVFLLGHSAGGVVSCTYALDRQSELAGLICESFAFQVPAPAPALAVIKFLGRIAPKLPVLKLKNKDFSRDPAAVRALEADPYTQGEVQPARTVAALLYATDRMRREFPTITLPVFILHGTLDKATVPAGSQFFYDTAGSRDKTLRLYEGHFHDLLNDTGKEKVLGDIVGWINARL